MIEEQPSENAKIGEDILIVSNHQGPVQTRNQEKMHEQTSKNPQEIIENINHQTEVPNLLKQLKPQENVQQQVNEIKQMEVKIDQPQQQVIILPINEQKQDDIDNAPSQSLTLNMPAPSIMESRKTIQSKICSQNATSNIIEPQGQNNPSFGQPYLINQKMLIEHPQQESLPEIVEHKASENNEQVSKVQAQHLSIESNEGQKYRLHSEFVQSIQQDREKKVVQFVQFVQEQPKNVEVVEEKQGQRNVLIQTENKQLNFSFSGHKQQPKQSQSPPQKVNSFSLHDQMIKSNNPRKEIGRIAKRPLHQKKIHDAIVILQKNDPKKIVIPRLQESKKNQQRKQIDLSKLDTHITLNSNILNITIGELMSRQPSEAGILLQQIQELKQKLFEMQLSRRREEVNEEDYYSPSQRDQYQSPSINNYESIQQENALSNKHNNRQSLGKFYRKIEFNHSKLSEQLTRAGLATERKGNTIAQPDYSISKPRFSSAEAFQRSDSNPKDKNIDNKGPVLFRVKRNNKQPSYNIDNQQKQRQTGFIKFKDKSIEKDKCFQAKRDNPKLQFTEEEILNIIDKPVPRQLKIQQNFRQYADRFFLDLGNQMPKRNWNQEQLVSLAKLTFKKFGVNIEMEKDLILHVKKYKNCVSFIFDSTKTILWYYEGKFYYGGWVIGKEGQGEKDGWGYEYSPNKFVYSGNFKNNKRDGYGIMKFLSRENDTLYEGYWKNGLKNGLGMQKEVDEAIYIGQWQNGKKNGKGKQFVSSNESFEGDYLNGLKHGTGKETFVNGDSYSGHYFQGKFHGSGIYTWANFSKYQGQFRDGSRNGNGKWISDYRDPNSDQYEGQYSNDKKSGFGLYKWKDGTVYEGQFLNDLKHGQGVVSYGDGKSTRLQWFQGNIVSQETSIDKIKPSSRRPTNKQSSQRSEQSKGSGSKPPLVKFNIKSTSKSKANRSPAGIQQM